MEINNINSLSTINDSNILNRLNSNQNVLNDFNNSSSNTYLIDNNITPKRSDLYTNLSPIITSISQNQIELSNANIQNNILNSISNEITKLNNTNQLSNTQNSIKELMTNYNNYEINVKQINNINESHSYFDGALGANHLNVNQIVDEVQGKQDLIKQRITLINDNILDLQTKATNTIDKEVAKVAQAMPFKNIDFGKHTSDFTSANINSIVGSVALSQANAIPSNSPRLLA